MSALVGHIRDHMISCPPCFYPHGEHDIFFGVIKDLTLSITLLAGDRCRGGTQRSLQGLWQGSKWIYLSQRGKFKIVTMLHLSILCMSVVILSWDKLQFHVLVGKLATILTSIIFNKILYMAKNLEVHLTMHYIWICEFLSWFNAFICSIWF